MEKMKKQNLEQRYSNKKSKKRGEDMEEAKQAIKNFFTKLKKNRKRFLKLLILLVVVIVFLAGSTYDITIEDGTYKEKDWSSTPYAAGEYTKGVSVKEDGTLESKTTAQELWDKMQKEKSRVSEYLKSPEELARLMKAEIVTQYPDTRPYPNQSIDWDEVIEDPNALQGIIKFKRAKTDGNIETMTYVEPQILEGWIEDYNTTGSEEAKKKATSHFTLRKSTEVNAGTNVTTSGKVADVSEKIIKELVKKSTYGLSGSVCQTWVGTVYERAGFGYTPSGCCAYLAGTKWGISKDFSQIVNGAAVWTGKGSYRGTKSCSHASQRWLWSCWYLL